MSKKFIFVNTDGDFQESPGAYESSDFISSSSGAADAGKPIVLNASGKVDSTMVDAVTDHGSLTGLGDDDHTQYILADGTRAFTGNVNLGSHLINNVTDPVSAQDAATKAYVDTMSAGLRPHPRAQVATTANLDLSANAPATIDNYTLQANDRVLVRAQTDAKENGVYIFTDTSSVLTRATDFDGTGEAFRGSFIPEVTNGDTYGGYSFVQTNTGTGINDSIDFGTDDVSFEVLTSIRSYTGGDGIEINYSSKNISIDLLDSDSGLTFSGTGSDELAIDWATTFTIDSADDKAIKASDLASTANGEGASRIGIEDSSGNFTADNVEGALSELASSISGAGGTTTFTADGAITKGDLVYISGNNQVHTHDGTTNNHAIGIAAADASDTASVEIYKDDNILTSLLTGATAGTKYYWDGSAWSTTMPTTSGFYVWRVGCAKNATDAFVEVEFIKRNS